MMVSYADLFLMAGTLSCFSLFSCRHHNFQHQSSGHPDTAALLVASEIRHRLLTGSPNSLEVAYFDMDHARTIFRDYVSMKAEMEQKDLVVDQLGPQRSNNSRNIPPSRLPRGRRSYDPERSVRQKRSSKDNTDLRYSSFKLPSTHDCSSENFPTGKRRRGHHHTPCCRQKLSINLDLLGPEFDFIVEPRVFDMRVCSGVCRAWNGASATTHALLRTLLHKYQTGTHRDSNSLDIEGVSVSRPYGSRNIDDSKIGAPCCSPSSLSSIDVLHFDSRGKLRIDPLEGAVADSCMCV